MVRLDGNDTVGPWSPREEKISSTWRGAEAVFRTLLVYKQLPRGKTVLWFCDNRNVSYIKIVFIKTSIYKIDMNVKPITNNIYTYKQYSLRHTHMNIYNIKKTRNITIQMI